MHRCRESVDFALQCAWLLDAYSSDVTLPTQKKSHGTKLKNLILSDELRPKAAAAAATSSASSKMKWREKQVTVSVTPLTAPHDLIPTESRSHLLTQVGFSIFPPPSSPPLCSMSIRR